MVEKSRFATRVCCSHSCNGDTLCSLPDTFPPSVAPSIVGAPPLPAAVRYSLQYPNRSHHLNVSDCTTDVAIRGQTNGFGLCRCLFFSSGTFHNRQQTVLTVCAVSVSVFMPTWLLQQAHTTTSESTLGRESSGFPSVSPPLLSKLAPGLLEVGSTS